MDLGVDANECIVLRRRWDDDLVCLCERRLDVLSVREWEEVMPLPGDGDESSKALLMRRRRRKVLALLPSLRRLPSQR